MSARKGARGRYGTGMPGWSWESSTAVLSPLERFYGPMPAEVPEVPACPACGGRPCPGCGATALDLFGGAIVSAKPGKCSRREEVAPTLFDYREM